jgi:hypothetical protein
MKMRRISILLALLLVMGATPGWSVCATVDRWVDDQAKSEVYPVKVGGMFLRGIHRMIESPVEIGYHTYDGAVNRTEYGVGALKGLGTGVLWMADSVLRGAWDIITALFPDYHGEPGTHDLDEELYGGEGG